MNPALARRLETGLAALRAADLHRVRRVVDGAHAVRMRVDGRDCINFCSNDYLGLGADPRVAEAARSALSRLGTGSGASALISGYNAEHRALEEELADFLGRERVLLFSSGWAANLGVIRALLDRDDALIADELNHASLIDGGRLSGARYLRVAHRDTQAFEQALAAAGEAFKLVVTDAVFSMDGDLADLSTLSALCHHHDATLMVDDAHGFGVLGARGRGALEVAAADGQVPLAAPLADIQIATLGKALGCAGAFVAGDAELIDYLVQRARSWVFSTAPPPALAAAARCALRMVVAEPERRAHLAAMVQRFRAGALQRGLPLGVPGISQDGGVETPIQVLVLGPEARALQASRLLLERGYWVAAIRPPTVPRGTSRLRITLSAAHDESLIDGLLDALADSLRLLPSAA